MHEDSSDEESEMEEEDEMYEDEDDDVCSDGLFVFVIYSGFCGIQFCVRLSPVNIGGSCDFNSSLHILHVFYRFHYFITSFIKHKTEFVTTRLMCIVITAQLYKPNVVVFR